MHQHGHEHERHDALPAARAHTQVPIYVQARNRHKVVEAGAEREAGYFHLRERAYYYMKICKNGILSSFITFYTFSIEYTSLRTMTYVFLCVFRSSFQPEAAYGHVRGYKLARYFDRETTSVFRGLVNTPLLINTTATFDLSKMCLRPRREGREYRAGNERVRL